MELENNELLNIDGGCLYLSKIIYIIGTKIRKFFNGFYII